MTLDGYERFHNIAPFEHWSEEIGQTLSLIAHGLELIGVAHILHVFWDWRWFMCMFIRSQITS